MPRYSTREVFGDGEFAYDDRYDTGEFTLYGQSRGPSSNAYSDGEPNGRHISRRAQQVAYDEHGYPIEGAYAGERDLRRRIARYTLGESMSRTDPRTRLGRDEQYAYDASRRSRLLEQTYVDEREARRPRRREGEREHERERGRGREREQAELEFQIRQEQEQDRERRRAARNVFDARNARRNAITAENDDYVAFQQRAREQQMREFDETPEAVRRYGRGYFPAYEFR